jgi:ABC-type nitrate/sulfonate/bicarbonate transport system permease component
MSAPLLGFLVGCVVGCFLGVLIMSILIIGRDDT